MSSVAQGDLLTVSGLSHPAVVVSNDTFNQSGKAVVCPVLQNTAEGPLHIKLQNCPINGYVICEQVRYIDLTCRAWSKVGQLHLFDIMDISDAVMGIFEHLR